MIKSKSDLSDSSSQKQRKKKDQEYFDSIHDSIHMCGYYSDTNKMSHKFKKIQRLFYILREIFNFFLVIQTLELMILNSLN